MSEGNFVFVQHLTLLFSFFPFSFALILDLLAPVRSFSLLFILLSTARLSGLRLEGEQEEQSGNSIMARLKNYLPSVVSNLGFFAILAFASVSTSSSPPLSFHLSPSLYF